jgi:hypothetical protein
MKLLSEISLRAMRKEEKKLFSKLFPQTVSKKQDPKNKNLNNPQ